MRIIAVLCFVLFCSCVSVHGENEGKGCTDAQSHEEKVEFSCSFPSCLSEDMVREYAEVVKKRLSFISGREAGVDLKGRKTVFSFVKGDLTDDEIGLLNCELLSNFQLSLHEVFNDRKSDQIADIVLKSVIMKDGESLVEAVAKPPFLTLLAKDISKLDIVMAKEGGAPVVFMSITLKKKSAVLEEKSVPLAKTPRQFYIDCNNGFWVDSPMVGMKMSDRFAVRLDDEYLGKLLEMQYKYPLPEPR